MAGVGRAATWAGWARAPLSRMLLLSLSLHAAVIGLVQPRAPTQDAVVVIHARLSDQVADATEEMLPIPPPPETANQDPVPPVESAPSVPSVAPPPPPQAEARPIELTPGQARATQADLSLAPEASTPRSLPTPGSALPSVPVIVDPNWYEARQLDVQPQAASAITPVYPADAYRKGLQGSVVLRMKIDEFGQVRDLEVASSDPPGVFDDSALAAFSKGRFKAGRRAGQPVRAQILVRVTYELGEAKPLAGGTE